MNYNVAIYGTGKGANIVEKYLNRETTSIVNYFDNDPMKVRHEHKGKIIYMPIEAFDLCFDYIIISVIDDGEAAQQLINYGIDKDKFFYFFDEALIDDKKYQFLLSGDWKIALIHQLFTVRFERLEKKMKKRLNNISYEMYDIVRSSNVRLPQIESADKAIELIIKNNYSLCRFGDYEFEIMMGRQRARYQKLDSMLAERLKEILVSEDEKILVAIADNYGSLEKYTENAADAIRDYLTDEVRRDHINLLNMDKIYYDAYLSRPYIIYRDKEKTKEKFEKIMRIWSRRDVVIIEGDKTRMGIGNDLFSGAHTVRRIIAPNKDAFDKYSIILDEALKLPKSILFVIALGSTATVLAYDLSKAGYQAIDIGHIDNEYEWFIHRTEQREYIKNKYVNEVLGGDNVISVSEHSIEGIITNVCVKSDVVTD